VSRSKYDEKVGQILFFYVSEERGVDPTPPRCSFVSCACASTFIRETERQRNRESERGDSKNGGLTLLFCDLCFSDSIEKRKRRRQKLNDSRPTKESRWENVPTLYLSFMAHPRSSAHTRTMACPEEEKKTKNPVRKETQKLRNHESKSRE